MLRGIVKIWRREDLCGNTLQTNFYKTVFVLSQKVIMKLLERVEEQDVYKRQEVGKPEANFQ